MAESAATETKETQPAAEGEQDAGVEVQQAEVPEAEDSGATQPGGQVEILLDTTVPVSASLGQVDVEVREILQMGKGSVVKLDTPVGDLVDLYLRGIRFARGQLVVVGDQLGVRIQEILPAKQDEEASSSQ